MIIQAPSTPHKITGDTLGERISNYHHLNYVVKFWFSLIHSRTAFADRKHVTALKGDDRILKAKIYAPDN